MNSPPLSESMPGDWIPDNELARVGDSTSPLTRSAWWSMPASALRRAGSSLSGTWPTQLTQPTWPPSTDDMWALPLAGGFSAVSLPHEESYLTWRHLCAGSPRHTCARMTASRRADDYWADEFVRIPVVEVRQDGSLVSRHRLPWPAAPGRVFRIPFSVLKGVDRRGSDVTLSLG